MPEAPDFDVLARELVDKHGLARLDEWDPGNSRFLSAAIAGQFRYVWAVAWNARGAADRLACADLLVVQPSNICEPVQYAIRKLDR